MRQPKVSNKYKLTMEDVKNLKIKDRSKVCEPLFWRNESMGAWCISRDTIKDNKDSKYGTYSDFWIGIHDKDSIEKRKLDINVSALGGMCNYNFNHFFDESAIDNEMDLEIQEKLLETINKLIDMGILSR